MKIYKSISHLHKKEQNDLRVITKKITESLQPEAIFCFGNRLSQNINRSSFTERKRYVIESAGYDLFIVISDADRLEESTALAFINRLISNFYNTTIIVHRKERMLKELEEGNFFLSWVLRTSMVLYDRYTTFKQLPGINKNKCHEVYPESHSLYLRHMKESAEYMTKTVQNMLDKDYYAALITLQQAASYSIKALLIIAIGYDGNNSDLHSMIRLCKNFTDIVSMIFCQKTEEELHLYRLITSSPDKLLAEKDNIQQFEVQILQAKVRRLKQSVNDYQFKNNTLLKHRNSAQLT